MADLNDSVLVEAPEGSPFVGYNPTPMVVIAGWGWNHLYYYEVDHAPEADEYFRIGQLISAKMAADIGQLPQRWEMVPASEWNVELAAQIMRRDPVKVT